MKNKRFIFEFGVDAVPHNKKTAEAIYGKNAYNSDFGVESHASSIGFQILQDAFSHNMLSLSKHLAECKCEPENMNETQKRYYDYLERKIKATETAMESFKFARK